MIRVRLHLIANAARGLRLDIALLACNWRHWWLEPQRDTILCRAIRKGLITPADRQRIDEYVRTVRRT
jgi:hypothetical protein